MKLVARGRIELPTYGFSVFDRPSAPTRSPPQDPARPRPRRVRPRSREYATGSVA